MCYLLFLLGQVVLDLLHIQKLGAEFESQWQLVTKDLSVAFDLSGVSCFELTQGLSVFFLCLKKILVPLLIELLVLLNMCLLALLTLLSLIENQLLVAAIIILLFELCDSILGHLGLNIFPFALTCVSVVFKYLAI